MPTFTVEALNAEGKRIKADVDAASANEAIGKLKAWVHGWKQSHVVNPGDCHACRLCIEACPEEALELRPLT